MNLKTSQQCHLTGPAEDLKRMISSHILGLDWKSRVSMLEALPLERRDGRRGKVSPGIPC